MMLNREKLRIELITNFTKIDTICSFSFLRISRQLVIRFGWNFFDFVELIKGYKTKKSLSKLDVWMARKSQKTDFLTLWKGVNLLFFTLMSCFRDVRGPVRVVWSAFLILVGVTDQTMNSSLTNKNRTIYESIVTMNFNKITIKFKIIFCVSCIKILYCLTVISQMRKTQINKILYTN